MAWAWPFQVTMLGTRKPSPWCIYQLARRAVFSEQGCYIQHASLGACATVDPTLYPGEPGELVSVPGRDSTRKLSMHLWF